MKYCDTSLQNPPTVSSFPPLLLSWYLSLPSPTHSQGSDDILQDNFEIAQLYLKNCMKGMQAALGVRKGHTLSSPPPFLFFSPTLLSFFLSLCPLSLSLSLPFSLSSFSFSLSYVLSPIIFLTSPPSSSLGGFLSLLS